MAKQTTEELINEIMNNYHEPEPEVPETSAEKVMYAICGGRMIKAAKEVINHPECPIAILRCLECEHIENHLSNENLVRLNYEIDCAIPQPVTLTKSHARITITNPDYEEYLAEPELYDREPEKTIRVNAYDGYRELNKKVLRDFYPSDRPAVILEALKHGLVDELGSIWLSSFEPLKKFAP